MFYVVESRAIGELVDRCGNAERMGNEFLIKHFDNIVSEVREFDGAAP